MNKQHNFDATNSMDVKSAFLKVAERTLQYDFSVWFWGDAITFDGLVEASVILGDERFIEHCTHYLNRWLEESPSWTDALAPGDALIRIGELKEDAAFLNGAQRLEEWFTHRVPRLHGGKGPQFFRPDWFQYRQYVWVDSLYHVPSFYARFGNVTDRSELYTRSMDTWDTHCEVLSMDGTPILHHSCNTANGHQRGFGWGRGNGWALLGAVDTWEQLPEDFARREKLKHQFQELGDALLEIQDESGFWRTLLTHQDAYLESSTASIYGAAFYKGLRLGILDQRFKEAADRAFRAALTRLNPDGGFFGVSTNTMAQTIHQDEYAVYKSLPTEVNVWGQGGMLRLLAEHIRYYS